LNRAHLEDRRQGGAHRPLRGGPCHLTRAIKSGGLKSWAMRIAKRAGMQKAKVALARKLAVISHRMLERKRAGSSIAAAKGAAGKLGYSWKF
jgi:hypothetical protein